MRIARPSGQTSSASPDSARTIRFMRVSCRIGVAGRIGRKAYVESPELDVQFPVRFPGPEPLR
jgi:hypothetical protein